MQAGIPEPGTRAWVRAISVNLLICRDPLLDVRRIRLIPPPLESPPALLGFLRQRAEYFEFAEPATDRKLLHKAELRGLLHRIYEVLAIAQIDEHIGLRLFRLNEVRREVCRAKRR